MIERIYIKEHILFSDMELLFKSGLIVFTGSSGSGKSVFFEALLSVFGIKNSDMNYAEISLQKKKDSDEVSVFEQKKVNNKTRYYIDKQNISKKNILQEAKEFISFLHVQDFSDFSSSSLINLLDSFISTKDNKYSSTLSLFKEKFNSLQSLKKSLDDILKNEKEILEKKEFLEFEVKRIKDINPNEDEYEELMETKKNLSKKEKIEEKLQNIEPIFDYEDKIIDFLNSMNIESSFINTFMSELSEHMQNSQDKLNELSGFDIESVLDRIDDLSKLKQRYGSIKEALDYQKEKEKELDAYEDVYSKKDTLKHQIDTLVEEIDLLANKISSTRNKHNILFQKDIDYYISRLYLNKAKVILSKKELDLFGIDSLSINIGDVNYDKISSGEANRLRLSLIALKNKYKKSNGVLILDEIDANLSGVESESVAKVLYEISQNYQVFSISHQPHLASYANQHFLVSKGDKSTINEITKEERIKEIARMISGKNITPASIKLAKELFSKGNLY